VLSDWLVAWLGLPVNRLWVRTKPGPARKTQVQAWSAIALPASQYYPVPVQTPEMLAGPVLQAKSTSEGDAKLTLVTLVGSAAVYEAANQRKHVRMIIHIHLGWRKMRPTVHTNLRVS
jgi:hypothetical protein